MMMQSKGLDPIYIMAKAEDIYYNAMSPLIVPVLKLQNKKE